MVDGGWEGDSLQWGYEVTGNRLKQKLMLLMSNMIYSYRRKETSGHTQTKWCGAPAKVSERLRQFIGPHNLRREPPLNSR